MQFDTKRQRTLSKLGGFLLLAAGGTAGAAHSSGPASMAARDEIVRQVPLAQGAIVDIFGIAGPVSAKATSGSVAEIRILRAAATEEELRCYETKIDAQPDHVTIRHVQFSDRAGCAAIRDSQVVSVRLPRGTALRLSNIAGNVDVEGIAGLVVAENVAGHANVAGARAAQLSGLAAGLSLASDDVDQRGIQASSINGQVDLRFGRHANSDVRLSSISGDVERLSAGLTQVKSDGGYDVRVGSGGALVSISRVNGTVRLHRE